MRHLVQAECYACAIEVAIRIRDLFGIREREAHVATSLLFRPLQHVFSKIDPDYLSATPNLLCDHRAECASSAADVQNLLVWFQFHFFDCKHSQASFSPKK